MAREIGRSTINIIEDIQDHHDDYDYFQAIRLLTRLKNQTSDEFIDSGNAQKHSVQDSQIQIRIQPELSLDYAENDILDLEEDVEGNLKLTTSFMGLYGISSPLPAYYTEELLDDEWEGDTAPRDFLDIIHQHLYPLLFRAWQKYRFTHQTLEQSEEKYWDVLYSIIGLSDVEFRACSKYSQKFLPYLGLLSQKQKSLVGLKTILKDVLNTNEIEITPCAERKVDIPEKQYCYLGTDQVTLGQDATIGQQIDDRMGKAVIKIRGVSSKDFQKFLHDSDYLDFIRTLTKFYLVQPLDIEVRLVLDPFALQTSQLGAEAWCLLGRDTWLQSDLTDKNSWLEKNQENRLTEVILY